MALLPFTPPMLRDPLQEKVSAHHHLIAVVPALAPSLICNQQQACLGTLQPCLTATLLCYETFLLC